MTTADPVSFESGGLTRRTLCKAGTALGALAVAGLAVRPAWAAARYPLYLPPLVNSPTGYDLSAAPAQVDFGPHAGTAWAYNHGAGGFPGPTFVAASGASVSVDFINGLALQASSVHWHGMVVETAQDGQPQDVVSPGQQRRYAFTIRQRAALNWYHPHPHMDTGEQVNLGLAGAFIVRDAEEAALGLPGGSYEVPLIVRDANFDKKGNLLYNPRRSGFVGRQPLVNGTLSPTLDVAPELYRLRVLNGANARLFTLGLRQAGATRPFWLLGNDGGLLAQMGKPSSIEFGPGERLDLLVDFRGLAVGTQLLLVDVSTGWDLLEFMVVGQVDGGVPGTINPKAGLPLSTIVSLAGPGTPTRSFSFDGMSRINGREYDMDRIDFTVPAGAVERWRFNTGGNAPHPVHVHGASFQVVSRSGGRGRLFPWEGGWKDTVLLKDNETVDVWIRFDSGYTGPAHGRYLLHCHKLEHEDMGMMANFVVG
jgi:FtsP/CotA-like multicopper oxidase with cupredoxin domain